MEVINTIFSKKHINLASILRRGVQNLSIFHPHKRPLKDMNDSSLQLHLERKRKQMDVGPPPREPQGLQWGWMNNTKNTRLNPPRSVPQLQQEPESPLWAAVPLLLSIHGEKILLTHKTPFLYSQTFPAPAAYCENTSDFSPRRRDTSSGRIQGR